MFDINNSNSPTETKGGLSYDLVLDEPSIDIPPKIGRPLESIDKQISAEDIENKLREAEERRKGIEAQKLSAVKDRNRRVSETQDRLSEIEEQKIECIRQSLEKRMESMKENRDSHIKAIQEKSKEEISKVEAINKTETLLPAVDQLKIIKQRIELAAESREAHIIALQERCREHDRHVESVRKIVEDLQQTNYLTDKSKYENKLEKAEKNRQIILDELRRRLKEHGEKVALLAIRRKSDIIQFSD